METRDRFEGCLLGLACGDALGAQVEFRERFAFETPTEMVGGGPFDLGPGEWTDDTSMALCLAESLLHCKRFNPVDQMNRYCNWMNYGYMSSNGRCFDIGITTAVALRRYIASNEPFAGNDHPNTAGNGSLMRLAPIAMYFCNDLNAARDYAALSSKTTHGAAECLDACQIYVEHLIRALHGETKEQVLNSANFVPSTEFLRSIVRGDWRSKTMDVIGSSGYVAHSLQASLWCIANTENYEDAILRAVSLGDDTDTTAAITGQLAGALYGVNAIPERWLEKLVDREMIRNTARAIYKNPYVG